MMAQYIATFHTHLAAIRTDRSLRALGLKTQMTPVPRKLSSSCGTCVRYEGEAAHLDLMDTDVEDVYLVCGADDYELLHHNN